MYYRETDTLPEVESVVVNPVYASPAIAEKVLQARTCLQPPDYSGPPEFNESEIATMEHVKHQRINFALKAVATKALKIFASHPERLEALKRLYG